MLDTHLTNYKIYSNFKLLTRKIRLTANEKARLPWSVMLHVSRHRVGSRIIL